MAIPLALFLLVLGLPALAADPGRPDPAATPGALNPQVTQANIHETICRRGWTSTIRPPRDFTTSLKRQQLARGPYAAWHARLRDYEEDHLVPLSLGGAPWDERNLWPEPIADAERKDDPHSVTTMSMVRASDEAASVLWPRPQVVRNFPPLDVSGASPVVYLTVPMTRPT